MGGEELLRMHSSFLDNEATKEENWEFKVIFKYQVALYYWILNSLWMCNHFIVKF